jgi:hypothetical protein
MVNRGKGVPASKRITVKWIDEAGKLVGFEYFTPRLIYTRKFFPHSRTPDGQTKYCYVIKDKISYQIIVKESEYQWFGEAVLRKRESDKLVLFKTSVAIEQDTADQIAAYAARDGITYAEAMRQVIEFGLEQLGFDEYDDLHEKRRAKTPIRSNQAACH